MTLMDYLRAGLGMGLQAGGALLGVIVVVALACLAVYLVALAGWLAHAAILGRRLRRLEPGIDRPHGIDAVERDGTRRP